MSVSERSLPSMGRRILRFFGGRLVLWMGIGIAAALLLGVVELGISAFLQLFLHSLGVIPASMRPAWLHAPVKIRWIATMLITIAILRAIAQLGAQVASLQAMEGVSARLRRLAIHRMVTLTGGRVVPAAEINAQLADTFPKAAYAANYGAAFLATAAQTVLMAGMLLWTSPREAVIGLCGLGAVGLLVLRINRTIRSIANQIPGEQKIINVGIERVARNLVLMRVLRTQDRETATLTGAVDAFARHSIRSGTLAGLATSTTPFLGTLLLTLVIVGSQRFLHTPGLQLVSFLYLFVRFVQMVAVCVQTFSVVNHCWPQFMMSWRLVQDTDDADLARAFAPARATASSAAARVAAAPREPPSIELRDVSFRYDGGEREVVEDLSLRIAGGEQFAIIGPSGCGKSTVLLLVLGLLEPQRGAITIDGEEPAEFFARSDVRVGYVGAEAFLIAGTIRENLLYGAPDNGVSDDMLWSALEQAQLRDAIERLPARLDYRLGENGEGLSAGQQQRLCLARALLHDPALLILDEATANLDAETEREIAEVVASLRCTTILVSHRAGMLKHAKRVLELGPSRQAA